MNATKRILIAVAMLGAVAIVPASRRANAAPGTAANTPAPVVAKPLIVLPPESRNEGNTTGWISPTAIDFGSHPVGTSTTKVVCTPKTPPV